MNNNSNNNVILPRVVVAFRHNGVTATVRLDGIRNRSLRQFDTPRRVVRTARSWCRGRLSPSADRVASRSPFAAQPFSADGFSGGRRPAGRRPPVRRASRGRCRGGRRPVRLRRRRTTIPVATAAGLRLRTGYVATGGRQKNKRPVYVFPKNIFLFFRIA